MPKKKTPTEAQQWMVTTDVRLEHLAGRLESLSIKRWDVVTILGPFSGPKDGGMVIVSKRIMRIR